MSEVTTVGNLLINDALPEDMRRHQHTLDKGGVHKLMMELAEKHPEQYKEVLQKLSDVGKTTVWTEGLSLSLAALRRSKAKERVLAPARAQIREIIDRDDLDHEQRREAIAEVLLPVATELKDALMEEAREERNPFLAQIESGARGNPGSFSSIRGADLLATDQQDRFIPLPLMHSYAEGYTPAEYFAASYGQRKGALDVKMCLSGDTLVRMADYTVRRIDDIQPGEWVMGATADGTQLPTRVVRVYDNGPRRVVRATFRPLGSTDKRGQLIVDSTLDHKFLTRWHSSNKPDYTPTKRPLSAGRFYARLDKTQYVAVPARAEVRQDDGKDEPRAALLGLMLGDGCGTKRYSLSCGDPSLITDLPFESWYLSPRPPKQGYSYSLNSTRKYDFVRDPAGRVVGTGHPTLRWLDSMGLRGCYAWQKSLPDEVWQWSTESVAELVGGLLAADGTVSHTHGGATVKLSLTSQILCAQVSELLRVRLGIYTSPVRELPIRSCMRRPQWYWSIAHGPELQRLAETIPIPGEKGRRLRKLLQRSKSNRKEFGFRLSSIVELGELPTFDLEVEHPDHLFVLANGLVSSNSTADAGFLNKQLVNAAHRQVITHEEPRMARLPTGLPVDTADRDNIGAVLAVDIEGYPSGTVIDDEILQDLQDKDVDEILIFSPLTEISEDGGISAMAAGRRQRQGFHQIGDNVGIPAAQAIGERLSEGALGSKHAAGVGEKASRSGFEYINRLIQSPETFPESGPLAEKDGMISQVEEAPQGGHYITVGDDRYYAPAGVEVTVKPGDKVEQGDDLTDGVPHPNQLVRLRGMGEARREYTKHLYEALKNSGVKPHRRNVESVVAGLLNWAKVTNPDGIGDNIYDDVVPYGSLMSNYKPRPTAQQLPPGKLRGKYLEEPVLHYTPGTRINKRMIDRLERYGIKDVYAHDEEPDFEPMMVRGLLSVYHDPDWRTRLSGFYTARAFQKSLHRGAVSDTHSTSFVPALGQATDFGKNLETMGKYGSVTALLLGKGVIAR